MSDNNRNLRVRVDTSSNESNVAFKLEQDIDNIEILSLKLSTGNFYKYHNSEYGCIVGRVIANGGIGVPNARISLFVRADDNWLDENILSDLYPYTSVMTKNDDGIRYNVLPEEVVSKCHTPVGTMPSKRMLLDDDNILEVYENFYKFTTVSNNAGDYMLFGIPTGDQIIHMDLDLSDCGYLTQRPRDMMYKGYNIDMFENANKFKGGTNLDNLPQIISRNDSIYVYPFWGNEEEGNEAKITRNDITVDYEFVPTCVFIGSIVSDEENNSISKNCIPAERMGQMDRLTAGSGRIEMIRKNANDAVEEFQVQGTELIDGNGTWCYQIPMNLDYMKTDEYGNLVPSEDPSIGIATRTRVRFRISLNDYESDYAETHIAKVLVPNNPKTYEDLDYHFGSMAMDEEDGTKSFRDLFWNNVYTVKSYIPRIQKGNRQRNRKFSGFKTVNISEGKNQIPYNNLRIRFNFMYILMCSIMKFMVWLMKVFNKRLLVVAYKLARPKKKKELKCATLGDGVCPDLDGWYFAPYCEHGTLFKQTFHFLSEEFDTDPYSVDARNKDTDEAYCLTNQVDYLLQCIEINLAQEYEVIKFDFYNDWLNGLIYIPRWDARYRKKKTLFFGLIKRRAKTQACFDAKAEFPYKKTRRLTQQCALLYKKDDDGYYTEIASTVGCHRKKQKCHRKAGRQHITVFGTTNKHNGGGLCHVEETIKGDKVYYFKPCEFHRSYDGKYDKRVLMFATDIVLLGSLNDCDEHGIPMAFKELHSTSYLMPTNLAKTNMDNEGFMYAYGATNQSICKKARIETPVVALTGSAQTLTNYVKWSETNEDYEKQPDDITEYAITEAAGIDWGWTGPNQGDPNENIPYLPGGHFLGISCVNAQTNIKTCVNLSRVCEVGSTVSSRNYVLLRNGDDTEFAYIQPTGLISKDELNDSQFRTMFSTLNLNGLRTVVDEETNYRKYEFLSSNPINFGGEFMRHSDNLYYNKGKSRSDRASDTNAMEDAYLFTRTFEYRSNDYYKFRFGLKSDEELETLRKHYAINTSSYVSMPIYENSYYFYFGLVAGNSALDRLYRDYFANCESYDEDAAFFTYTTTDANQCTKNNGTITISFNNVESPYTIIISGSDGKALYFKEDKKKQTVTLTEEHYYHCLSGDGNNGVVDVYTTDTGNSNTYVYVEDATAYTTNLSEITIYGLKGRLKDKNGKYIDEDVQYSVYLASADGESKTIDISIGLKLPDEISTIKCDPVDFKEYFNYPQIRLWHEIQDVLSKTEKTEDEEKFLNNCGYVEITSSGSSSIIGFLVATDSTYTFIKNDSFNKETINNLFDPGKKLDYLSYKDGEFVSGEPVRVYLWDNNDTYTVYAIYYCSNEDEYFFLNVDTFSLSIQMPLDIYIGDEDLLYNETIKPLIDAGLCTRTNWWGYMMVEYSAITGGVYILSGGTTATTDYLETNPGLISSVITRVTPKHIWNIKRAFYYENSIYDTGSIGTASITIGPVGGTPPYKEVLFGAQERITVIGDEDDDDSEYKGYFNVTAPTNAYITDQDMVNTIRSLGASGGSVYNASDLTEMGFSMDLENIFLPTVGYDMAVGWCTKKEGNRYGYTKNEITKTDDTLVAISTPARADKNGKITEVGTHEGMPGLCLWGSNNFYSRQLCINTYNGPWDGDKLLWKRWDFKSNWEDVYDNDNINTVIDPSHEHTGTKTINGKTYTINQNSFRIGQKMLLARYRDDDSGPRWGPKIHYGIRYEDTYDGILKRDDNGSNPRIERKANIVPAYDGIRHGRDFNDVEFQGGTYWDAYGDRYYDKGRTGENGVRPEDRPRSVSTVSKTWHNPDERYFLTIPSIYAPFFFNTVFIISGDVKPTEERNSGFSVKCVFRINNGITVRESGKDKFSKISAKIKTNDGSLEIFDADGGGKATERFYRTTGDFPNYSPTVLNNINYKRMICGFTGSIQKKPGVNDWAKFSDNDHINDGFDKDMVYTLPFDLCDCMYDAMPMRNWYWARSDSDGASPFGPFDSFNNSFTSGKSKNIIYNSTNENTQALKEIVNGGQVSFNFLVREGTPSEDDDLDVREIEEEVSLKFFNAVDYGDSGNIRYFFVWPESITGYPFYENLSRSYTYYGRVHYSFMRDDKRQGNTDRVTVYSTYVDPDTNCADRPVGQSIVDRGIGNFIPSGYKPIFSGVYSSVFLWNEGGDVTKASIYWGASLGEIDARVKQWYAEYDTGDTPTSITLDIILTYLHGAFSDQTGLDGYVVGIHDQFLNADGSFKYNPDASHAIWDAVPKDTNLLSVVRVYSLSDFKTLLKGRYGLD